MPHGAAPCQWLVCPAQPRRGGADHKHNYSTQAEGATKKGPSLGSGTVEIRGTSRIPCSTKFTLASEADS